MSKEKKSGQTEGDRKIHRVEKKKKFDPTKFKNIDLDHLDDLDDLPDEDLYGDDYERR